MQNNKIKYKKESFMQGVFALMFSQILIKILGLVYNLYLTNREGFGNKGNAIYNSGFQIYALLLTLSSVGIPNAISKLVSERVALGDNKGANRIFKIAFATFGTIGFIGSMILFFGANYISNIILEIPEAELTLVGLSPSIFFVSLICVIRGYFNGIETMSVTAKSQTLEQIFKSTLTIILVEIVVILSGVNTTIMAAGANLATTIATIASFLYLYRYYKKYRKINAKEIIKTTNHKQEGIKSIIKKILYVSMPITLSAILSSLNRNIDSVTIVRGLKNFLSEDIAKAQYGILTGKVDTLTSLPLSFNIAFATALVPAIAAARATKDMNTANKRVAFSILITILIGLPCAAGMFIFSDQILHLLYPSQPDGGLLFKIASIAIIFNLLTQTINGALQGLGKVMVPAIALSIGVITKFIMNIVLVPIPEIGVLGAAIGNISCNFIAFSIGMYVLNKNMKIDIKFSKNILKPIIATFMMGICSYAIYILLSNIISSSIATIISIMVAIMVYVLAVVSLKIFTKEEIYMIPYGQKIYKLLEKFGIYKQENMT
ncbi:MAG: polysaccharide biosynthesis protein [Clostridia bacterium]|jgi:stage V sporulation protein B|nr:polysaccharide biosynthesis protein [Clostridia bacterium]